MADFLQSPSGQASITVTLSTPVVTQASNAVAAVFSASEFYSSLSGSGSTQMSIPFGIPSVSAFPSAGQQWPLGVPTM